LVALGIACYPSAAFHRLQRKQTPGCPGEAARQGVRAEKARISYPVEVESVQVRSLTYAVNAVGSVDAFEKVQVTARVAGVVDRVLFSEGNLARLGQVLVEIEPERYRLAVESAQAAHEKAQARPMRSQLKQREQLSTTPGLEREIETWSQSQVAAPGRQTKAARQPGTSTAPMSGLLSGIQTRTVQTGQYIRSAPSWPSLRRDPLLLRLSRADAARLAVGMTANFRVRKRQRFRLEDRPCRRLGRRCVPDGGPDGGDQDSSNLLRPAPSPRSPSTRLTSQTARHSHRGPSEQRGSWRMLLRRQGRRAALMPGMRTADRFVKSSPGFPR
jgi:pyruvate/2-oxoglutarate dehydrogenase complex dihydrolipoamide acyltransferase (E2) component